MAKVSHKSWPNLALLCIGKEQTSMAALWGAKFWSKKKGANEVFICTFRLALESDDLWKKYTTGVTKNKTHKKRSYLWDFNLFWNTFLLYFYFIYYSAGMFYFQTFLECCQPAWHHHPVTGSLPTGTLFTGRCVCRSTFFFFFFLQL